MTLAGRQSLALAVAIAVSGLLGFVAGYAVESRRGGPERRH